MSEDATGPPGLDRCAPAPPEDAEEGGAEGGRAMKGLVEEETIMAVDERLI